MEECYRSAASVLLLRPVSVCQPGGECTTIFQVLLLHKPRKKDDWQLPQGGVEQGETIEQAALRELHEEAGVKEGVEVIGKSTDCYKYDFPQSFRRFRPDNVCGQCIWCVYALAPEQTKVRVDNKEIDGHVWVLPDEITRYVQRKEYIEFVTKLLEEGITLARLRQGSGGHAKAI